MIASIMISQLPGVLPTSPEDEVPVYADDSASFLALIQNCIENHSICDISKKLFGNNDGSAVSVKQNIAFYYNTLRLSLRFKKNNEIKDKYLRIVSYIFPDQFVLNNAAEILTSRVAIPCLNYCYSPTQLGRHVRRKHCYAMASFIFRMVSGNAKRHPTSLPIISKLDRLGISAAQYLTVLSGDIKNILARTYAWPNERDKITVSSEEKGWIHSLVREPYIQTHDKLVEREKKFRPLLAARAIESSINFCAYFTIYLFISQFVAHTSSTLTRYSLKTFYVGASEEAVEINVQKMMAVLWYGTWIPFLTLNAYFNIHTIQDIYQGYRHDFDPHNTVLHDIGLLSRKHKKSKHVQF